MKGNNDMLIDLIYRKKKNLEMFVAELNDAMSSMSDDEKYIHEYELNNKKDDLLFLEELIKSKDKLSCDSLKIYLKELEKNTAGDFLSIKVDKIKIMKDLLKEYKIEYRKTYFCNKYVGLTGAFDNELFCSIIKRRIDKYTYCNKVTRTKYKHLTSFLTELFNEMENSNFPLKTLKHKMKLYQKYRKNEYIEIRKQQKTKISIIKEILDEYKKEKSLVHKM